MKREEFDGYPCKAMFVPVTICANPIMVEAQSDDGEWFPREFANEGAAAEFEAKMARREVSTRRGK